MPNYGYKCTSCSHYFERFKPMAESGSDDECPVCANKSSRVYEFHQKPDFQEYYDEQYNTNIRSQKQEEKLMKKHGHIYTADTKSHKKWETKRKQDRDRIKFYAKKGIQV